MKRLFSVFLAGVLLLGMVSIIPASASADDGFSTVAPEAFNISINNISWSLPTIDGQTITKSTYADKTVLFVFYRATMSGGSGNCGNSNNLIGGLASSSWIGASDLQVIAVDVDGNTAADVRAYKNVYAPNCSNIVFTYGKNNLMWNFYWAAYSSGSGSGGVTLAVGAVIKNNTLCYVWDGCNSATVCQIALSQVSSVPSTDDDLEERLAPILAAGSYQQEAARSMLTQVNALRTGEDAWYWNETDTAKVVLNGLGELTYDYALEQLAMRRAAELAILYSHTRPNGTSCFELSYRGVTSSGENIAYGYTTVQSMFDGWAEADEPYSGQGHRRNMLSGNFSAIGIGCFYYEGRYYWAQEFGWENSGIGEPDPGLTTSSGSLQNGLTWRVSGGVLTISGKGAMEDFERTAPWEVNEITSVIIENGVTGIGNRAFYNCTGVTDVSLPDSLTAIGHYAFSGCSGLKSVEIPASVKTMGWNVFDGCDSLKDIYCAASSEPAGWSFFWLGNCTATVYWTPAETDDPGTSDDPSKPNKPSTSDPFRGDIDGNGFVEATDYMLLKRAVLGTYVLIEEQQAAADINGDGEVDATDYMLLKRAVLGTYLLG